LVSGPTDAARVLEEADYTQQKSSPSAGVARPAAVVPLAGKVQPERCKHPANAARQARKAARSR
jgi:hypothetical protein